MPSIPAVDSTADYQFVSRSAGNTPEKIKAALEENGIFIKDISEQTDEIPVKADEPVAQPNSEQTPAEKEPVPGETTAATKTETAEPKPADNSDKAKPGVKERLKAKVETLTSESAATKAELQTERQKREQLERELTELRAGRTAPSVTLKETPANVVTAPDAPAEPSPRPKRPVTPQEQDFWEKDDPTAAYKAAVADHEKALEKYEDDLVDWRTDERDRAKRQADAIQREKDTRESSKAINEADQKERSDRWQSQVTESSAKHSDFKEKLTAAQEFTPVMIEAAHAMEQTAEIAYYLANNPDELKRIIAETNLPEKYSPSQLNKARKTAFVEYSKIEAKLAAEAPAEEADEEEATEQVAEPVRAPPVAEAPPVKVPPKKFTPVTTVGGRGGKSTKTLSELEKSNSKEDMDELRAMSLDEMRRRRKSGT